MTEIENIKKQTLASFIKDSLEKDAKIASLITTIESQKEEIEQLKREKEVQDGIFSALRKQAGKDIASQKAITELAVKGLKEIACLNVDSAYSAGTIARNTFSEIERLSK